MARSFRLASIFPGLAVFLAVLMAAPASAQPPAELYSAAGASGPSLGAGATLTAGSRGYRRLLISGDGQWKAHPFYPYAWTELSSDNSSRQFSLGGGAWRDLREDLRVKGGLGFTVGGLRDGDGSASSVSLEAGAEKDLETPTLGTEYRFTSGSIGGSRVIRSNDEKLRGRFNARREASGTSVSPEPFSYHEASGYARIPAGKTTVGLRLTLGLPSYSRWVLSETLSWKVPVSEPLALATALSFEQGRAANAYFSLGFYYLFGGQRA